MSEDRHINFKLLSQYILDQQDESSGSPADAGGADKPVLAVKKYWRRWRWPA